MEESRWAGAFLVCGVFLIGRDCQMHFAVYRRRQQEEIKLHVA